MTRKEAIEELERLLRHWDDLENDKRCFWGYDNEAVALALSALRPVSREQVEKVFSVCDFCKIELDDYPYIVAHSDYSSSDTCYEPSFCPICGKPLTDEAVDMMLERWEGVLYENNG